MIFPQLKHLKEDFEQTQHYIRRLEKDNESHRIPFYQEKLQRLRDVIGRLETLLQK